jgi:hypothetical protein
MHQQFLHGNIHVGGNGSFGSKEMTSFSIEAGQLFNAGSMGGGFFTGA